MPSRFFGGATLRGSVAKSQSLEWHRFAAFGNACDSLQSVAHVILDPDTSLSRVLQRCPPCWRNTRLRFHHCLIANYIRFSKISFPINFFGREREREVHITKSLCKFTRKLVWKVSPIPTYCSYFIKRNYCLHVGVFTACPLMHIAFSVCVRPIDSECCYKKFGATLLLISYFLLLRPINTNWASTSYMLHISIKVHRKKNKKNGKKWHSSGESVKNLSFWTFTHSS